MSWKILNQLLLLMTVAAVCFLSAAANDSTLKIATTSSLYDTGLLEELAQNFSEEYNVTVQIPTHSGTGIAISDGERGNVDMLIIHDKKGRSSSSRTATDWRDGVLLTITSIW